MVPRIVPKITEDEKIVVLRFYIPDKNGGKVSTPLLPNLPMHWKDNSVSTIPPPSLIYVPGTTVRDTMWRALPPHTFPDIFGTLFT